MPNTPDTDPDNSRFVGRFPKDVRMAAQQRQALRQRQDNSYTISQPQHAQPIEDVKRCVMAIFVAATAYSHLMVYMDRLRASLERDRLNLLERTTSETFAQAYNNKLRKLNDSDKHR